jgi:hypothetical protein
MEAPGSFREQCRSIPAASQPPTQRDLLCTHPNTAKKGKSAGLYSPPCLGVKDSGPLLGKDIPFDPYLSGAKPSRSDRTFGSAMVITTVGQEGCPTLGDMRMGRQEQSAYWLALRLSFRGRKRTGPQGGPVLVFDLPEPD